MADKSQQPKVVLFEDEMHDLMKSGFDPMAFNRRIRREGLPTVVIHANEEQ